MYKKSTCESNITGTLHANPSFGEELESARSVLRECLREACEVVKMVVPTLSHSESKDIPTFDARSIKHFSPQDARFLLGRYLNRFKAMTFNGADSIKLPVSGNRLNKVSRRLCEAAEVVSFLSRPIEELQWKLAFEFPGYQKCIYEEAATALLILNGWSKSPASGVYDGHNSQMALNILHALSSNGKIRLSLFVCPPVDYAHYFEKNSYLYLRTDMHGSVLSRQINRLRNLFCNLRGGRIHFDLDVFIADTDDDDYLSQGVARPRFMDNVALDKRREELVKSVTEYLIRKLLKGDQAGAFLETLSVVRLSAIQPSPKGMDIYKSVAATPFSYFTSEDVAAELTIMHELWKPGSYYDALHLPSDEDLTRIVIYKFATYAMQGVLLWEREPDLILIQTERPPLLRTKMLNVGRERLGLPILGCLNFF